MKLRLIALSAITALVGATLFAPTATATPAGLPNATLIGDINTSHVGSNIRYVTSFNNAVYFQATNFEGAELWKTTGGAAVKVTDLNPQDGGSYPYSLTVFQGKLYFYALKVDGTWLHSIDTSDNVVSILQASTLEDGYNFMEAHQIEASEDHLFFTQFTGLLGTELYSWQPQLGDTSTIEQISFPTGGGSTTPTSLSALGNKILFYGHFNEYSSEILEYNGTEIVAHPETSIRNSIVFNGILYFHGYSPSQGYEVWTYDGTTIARLTDISSSYNGTSPLNFAVMGGNLYFTGDYGDSGRRILLKLNGSGATVIAGAPSGEGVEPVSITAVGDKIYVVYRLSNGTHEFWTTTGSSLTRVDSLPEPGSPWQFTAVALGTDFYYPGSIGAYVDELVRVNSSTNTLIDTITDNPMTANSDAENFITFKNKMYFQAYAPEFGREWYSYDGVTPPSLLADIQVGPGFGVTWRDAKVIGDKMYFSADDGLHGIELWVYDGVDSPTMVSDQAAGEASSNPWGLNEFNGSLTYRTDDGLIWKLAADGTLTEIPLDPTNTHWSPAAQEPTSFDGKLFFRANYQADGGAPYENVLFVSDGENPATLVTDPEASPVYSDLLTATPNFLYFTAQAEGTGNELYRLGKNSDQIVRMTDIAPGSDSIYPRMLGYFNSMFYFTVNNSEGSLFTVNEAGDVVQIELTDGQGTYPRSMTSIGDTIYWIGQTEVGSSYYSMYGVWSQTLGGQPVKESESYKFLGMDMFPEATVYNGELYFYASDQLHGREVFRLGANPVVQRINVSKKITGFKATKSFLTEPMKASIRAFVNAHPTATIAKCVGRTAVGKTTPIHMRLAKSRAKVVCAYAELVHGDMDKWISAGTGKNTGKAFSRVMLTLKG